MDPNLTAATIGANQIQAPSSSLGASQGPELANAYRSSFQLPASSSAVSAQANVSQAAVAAAKAAAAAEAAKRQADLSDPSKYRQVPSKDGGFNYFDPNGNQVDIATLTQRTGTKPQDWIKGSEDPTDIQYQQDYQNLQKFTNAVLTRDKATVDKFLNNDPNLKQYTQGKGGIHNLINQFQQTYQRYYVPRSQDPQAWGRVPGGPVVSAGQSGNSNNSVL